MGFWGISENIMHLQMEPSEYSWKLFRRLRGTAEPALRLSVSLVRGEQAV